VHEESSESLFSEDSAQRRSQGRADRVVEHLQMVGSSLFR
jgi:hypothetical protein